MASSFLSSPHHQGTNCQLYWQVEAMGIYLTSDFRERGITELTQPQFNISAKEINSQEPWLLSNTTKFNFIFNVIIYLVNKPRFDHSKLNTQGGRYKFNLLKTPLSKTKMTQFLS